MQRRSNDKLTISSYLSIDIQHGAYTFGDSIRFFSLDLALNTNSLMTTLDELGCC